MGHAGSVNLHSVIDSSIVLGQSSSIDAVAILGIVLSISGSTYAGVSAFRAQQEKDVNAALSAGERYKRHVQEHGDEKDKGKNKKHIKSFGRAKCYWKTCGWIPIAMMIVISFVMSIHYLAAELFPDNIASIKLWPWYGIALAFMIMADGFALFLSCRASAKIGFASECMGDLADKIDPKESSASAPNVAAQQSPELPIVPAPTPDTCGNADCPNNAAQ